MKTYCIKCLLEVINKRLVINKFLFTSNLHVCLIEICNLFEPVKSNLCLYYTYLKFSA